MRFTSWLPGRVSDCRGEIGSYWYLVVHTTIDPIGSGLSLDIKMDSPQKNLSPPTKTTRPQKQAVFRVYKTRPNMSDFLEVWVDATNHRFPTQPLALKRFGIHLHLLLQPIFLCSFCAQRKWLLEKSAEIEDIYHMAEAGEMEDRTTNKSPDVGLMMTMTMTMTTTTMNANLNINMLDKMIIP